MTIKMTATEVRNFHVSYHMINTDNELLGFDGLSKVFDRIKSIQYDPLNVVGRNSDLVLQSRITNYSSSILDKALYTDRTLIDAWDKMMGIYQTKDYPYFSRIRTVMGTNTLNSLKYRLSIEAVDYIEDVLEYIVKNGPTFSSDINFGKTKKHVWGHTKPSSGTLDYLFHVGKLGVSERRNTQKKYDLLENLIGEICNIDDPNPLDEDFIRWYILRRVATQGFVSNRSGVMWSGPHISDKKIRTKYLNILVNENMLSKIEVEGYKEDFYVLTEFLNLKRNIEKRVSFIAPLDNLIWDRELVKKIYNFDYKWEVYTPIVKRKYGYYVLPILYGCDFIGRIQFKQQRNNDVLEVENIWFEDGFRQTNVFNTAFNKGLEKFAKYLGAKTFISPL